MLYILLLIVPALGLTDDEIAMFSPDHYPDHIERNTGSRHILMINIWRTFFPKQILAPVNSEIVF